MFPLLETSIAMRYNQAMDKIERVTVYFFLSLLMLIPMVLGGDTSRPLVPESNRMKTDHAPTPFSAEEIRKGCPDGRLTSYLIEIPGKPNSYSMTRFVEPNREQTGFENWTTNLQGKIIGKPKRIDAKWRDLQAHASYPEKFTSIALDKITIPAGSFECLRYSVQMEGDLKKLWFARALPGPPVKFEHYKNGSRVFSMILVKNEVLKK